MAYNSTIISKKKNLSCGHYDFAFSKGRCKQCATVEDSSKRIAKHEESIDDESLNNLIDDLDIVFSRYIRLKHADSKGIVKCCTCDTWGHYTDFDAGHFIHRTDLITRWNEYNVAPQCKVCNRFEDGKATEFAAYIESRNEGMSDYLTEQARQVWKPTRDELKQLLIEYRFKLKLLKQ